MNVENVRKKAVELLKECNQEKLASHVKNSKGLILDIFFTAKTHKQRIPFRPMVSQRGCWQVLVAGFLQKLLHLLEVHDPYLLENSEGLAKFMASDSTSCSWEFSIDVPGLYYCLPHGQVMCSMQCL